MAQLEVQLDELKEEQEEAVRSENYAVAEKLKNEMLLVRKKICNLKEDLFDGAVRVSREINAIQDEYYLDESDEVRPAILFIHSINLFSIKIAIK